MAPARMLLTNATLATFSGQEPYGLVSNGALVIEGERIVWAGPATEVPEGFRSWPARDLEGLLVTPALIDCHTHIVFGGDRSAEFEMRLNGATYEDIARAGGGILSTVSATRDSSVEQLVAKALPRVDALIREGVGVLEIKSGYGLDLATERRMLQAARQVGIERGLVVRTTFLGAHAVPPEYAGRADEYVDFVAAEVLPTLAEEGLVDAVDAFCENIAFSVEQVDRVFDVAHQLGLPIRIHAEQLSDLGGARLAASYGALSADHLEYLSPSDVPVLADAGTVAVLLPGAYYFLNETRLPPIESFREHGVKMGVATDCNPGSSPLLSLLTAVNMACTLFGLSPHEALAGATRESARALGLQAEYGRLEPGMVADLAIWAVNAPAELAYYMGGNPLVERWQNGHATETRIQA